MTSDQRAIRVNSVRLQHIQLGAGLIAASCCLALGALSLSVGLADYFRVRDGAQAFKRFETVSDAVNAVVAERAPANVLIATGTMDPDALRAMRRAREETDRLIDLAQSSLTAEDTDALYPLNELRASLAIGRQLIDAFVLVEPSARRSEDFQVAMEEMFATATAGDALRGKVGQSVIAIAPEVSVEVFLSLSVGGLRDQAGRFGSYVVLAQREARKEPATQSMLQATAGRISTSNRILSTLVQALPPGNKVAARLTQVEQQYFDVALRLGFDTVARVGSVSEIGKVEFARRYAQALTAIDGLREATVDSSQARLEAVGDAAFNRAAIAGTLMVLVCLILFATIVIFRRAMFAPLGRAREQAIAIARGDLTDPTSEERIGGEVGEMLAGLHAIRGEQRWRRELQEQQAEMALQLRRLSETDMLTGLLNRRAMEDLAARTLVAADQAGQRVGLLIFDIDHFKSINDTFGHGVGDEVLRKIAREVTSLLRTGDALARFGGEEFLVLMPDVGIEEARAIAETLRERIPGLVGLPEEDRRVTASFGLALREAGSEIPWETLVATADGRLYTAKRSGRNRVCDADVATPSAGVV